VSASRPFDAWERALAFRYLRAKRRDGGAALISVISVIGITLSVMALIVVMSIMNGFRAELLSRLLGFNGHIYVTGPAINGPSREDMIARLRSVPHVVQAVPQIEAQGLAIGPNAISFAVVRGLRPEDLAHTPIIARNIKDGSLRGFGQGEYGGDLILVGSRLAAQVGVRPGDELTLLSPTGGATAFGTSPRRKTYTVGGVFSIGVSAYDAAFVYMPLAQAQLFFGRDRNVDQIEINLDDADRIAAVRPEVARAAGAGAIVSDWRDRDNSTFTALQVEATAMRLILMILVAITTLNIISGLVMLVKNKARDIAILRTIGATRSSILRIFFMAGVIVGAAGTLAGLVLGTLFCLNIGPIQTLVETVTGVQVFNPDTYYLSRLPAKMNPGEVFGTVAFSLAMSSLFSVLPAAWASRFDPVEALRNE